MKSLTRLTQHSRFFVGSLARMHSRFLSWADLVKEQFQVVHRLQLDYKVHDSTNFRGPTVTYTPKYLASAWLGLRYMS